MHIPFSQHSMNRLFFLVSLLCLIACRASKNTTVEIPPTVPPKAKNIILLIGDGMGISQITAGLYGNRNVLNLERFKTIGFHKSYASNSLITDSAAGATAFACGVKTYNGAIGVSSDSISVPTILEEAEQKGKATGMVATSSIVHATPASFIAHQVNRNMYDEIAADFVKTDIDYFVGGGLKFFERRELDNRNISQELKGKGYVVSNFINEEFEDINLLQYSKFGFLTADDQPLSVEQGRDYLIPALQKGIQFLQNRSKEGFFFMVEGSQIDWGGHANNSDFIVREMIEFDKAIGLALTFAEKNKETLVIVTADHECGGYSINDGSEMGKIVGKFTTDYHTADIIPVFAYGPGSEQFGGIYENTEIYHKMRNAFGFD